MAASAEMDVYHRCNRPVWLFGWKEVEAGMGEREERMAVAPSRCRRQERGRSAPEWISHMQSVRAVASTVSRIWGYR